MPKPLRADEGESLISSPRKVKQQQGLAAKLKIEEHFFSSRCLTCDAFCGDSEFIIAFSSEPLCCSLQSNSTSGLCENCRSSPQETISALLGRVHKTETRLRQAHLICVSCSGIAPAESVDCESLDCPWLFERKKLEQKAESLDRIRDLVDDLAITEREARTDE